MPELASLAVNVTHTGAVDTRAALDGVAASGQKAEVSFASLAKQIAGFTTLADLAVRGAQAFIQKTKELAAESISLAAGFEKSCMTWGVLVGDMDKGKRVFDDLYAFASKTPLSFEGINQAATTLKAYGVATEDLIPTMKMLGDVAMGDNAKLDSVARAFGQIMSTGRLMGQDLLQLINQGFNPLQIISQKTGEDMITLKARMEKGGISAEEVAEAFKTATSEGGLFYKMMDKTAETTAGKLSTAMDNFKSQLAEIGERFLPAVNAALDTFNTLAERSGKEKNLKEALIGSGNTEEAIAYIMAERARIQKLIEQQGIIAAQEMVPSVREAKEAAIEALKAQLDELNEKYNQIREIERRKGASTGTIGSTPKPADTPKSASSGPTARPGGSDALSAADSAWEDRYEAQYAKYTEYLESEIRLKEYLKDVNRQLAEEWDREYQAALEASEKQRIQQAILVDLANQLNAVLANGAKDAYLQTMNAIGEALAGNGDAAENLGQALTKMALMMLNQLPGMLFTAGVRIIAEAGIAGLPVGLALIGASGLLAIGAGAANYAYSEATHSTTANALGNVYDSPSLSAYSNRVYNSPQYFAFKNGAAFGWEGAQAFARGGVFAEAGPEAIMPLARDTAGRLGVRSQGGVANVVVQIIDQTSGGVQKSTEETTGPNGEKQIRVVLRDAVRGMVAAGDMDSAMASRFGIAALGRRVK